MSGWWFGTWILFVHSVGNFIIPTDFHSIIFQRGRLNHQPDHHQYSTISTNINHWTSLNHIWYHGIFNRSSNHPSSSDIMVKWHNFISIESPFDHQDLEISASGACYPAPLHAGHRRDTGWHTKQDIGIHWHDGSRIISWKQMEV